MAALSPVPVRETIRKRTLVPGNDTDKGKAITMPQHKGSYTGEQHVKPKITRLLMIAMHALLALLL